MVLNIRVLVCLKPPWAGFTFKIVMFFLFSQLFASEAAAEEPRGCLIAGNKLWRCFWEQKEIQTLSLKLRSCFEVLSSHPDPSAVKGREFVPKLIKALKGIKTHSYLTPWHWPSCWFSSKPKEIIHVPAPGEMKPVFPENMLGFSGWAVTRFW